MEEKKQIDMLTKDSVSILTSRYIMMDGQEYQVGLDHRTAYVNSIQGRAFILSNEPQYISDTVLGYWGDTPTVVEKEYDTYSGQIG